MSQKPIPRVPKAPPELDFSQPEPAAQPKPAPAPPSRPNLVDYFLVLLGFALSVYLTRVGPLPVEGRDFVTDPQARTAVSYLSDWMRLPEGVLLLGPLFLALQFLLGRRQGLTSVGWLWVFSWLGVAVIAGLTACKVAFGFPDPKQQPLLAWTPWVPCLWYAILATTMGGLTVVFRLVGVFSRKPAPWTHAFGAALMIWSGLLAAVVLAVGRFKP